MTFPGTGRGLRIAKALLIKSFAESTAYRAEIVLWMIAGAFPLFMMLIWMSLAEAGPMGGFTAEDFAAYFLIVFFVHEMTQVWVLGQLDEQIRLGELSAKLLRPLNPCWEHLADHLCALAVRLPLLLPFVALGLLLTGGWGQIDAGRLPLFLLSLALSWTIFFSLHYCLGLLAFWTNQAAAFETLIYSLYIVLGGSIAPLALFPELLQEAVRYTPFPYIISLPVEILLQPPAAADPLAGLAAQLFWAALFIALAGLLWRRGLAKYAAFGS